MWAGRFKTAPLLQNLSLPAGLTAIRSSLFQGCTSLTEVGIPASVTSIEQDAFRNCTSLNQVTLPKALQTIEQDAFANTGLFNSPANWVDGALYIDGWCIKADTSVLSENYVIKPGTKGIADYAFADCTHLATISTRAVCRASVPGLFAGCIDLTRATLGEGIARIGASAFENCTNLTELNIPQSVSEVGCSAFESTGFYNQKSHWSKGILYWDNWVIHSRPDDVIGELTIKSGTRGIAGDAFSNCPRNYRCDTPARHPHHRQQRMGWLHPNKTY